MAVGVLERGDVVTVTGCVPDCATRSAWALLGSDGAVRLSLLRPLPAPTDALAGGSAATFIYGRVLHNTAVRDRPADDARVVGRIKAGRDLAFRLHASHDWLERPRGGFIRARKVRIASPSAFAGEHDPAPVTAFVRRATAGYERYDRVPVLALEPNRVLVAAGWLPRKVVRIAFAHPRPPAIPAGAKWVHIDLREQVLTAYEGDRLVFATLVSTGKHGDATRAGVFRVYHKAIHAAMHGTDPADPYFVDEVPHVQYFFRNMALHGTYWHDRFGQRYSHGCVNLSFADAEWLFDWAPPPLPAGWHAIEPQSSTLWVQVQRRSVIPGVSS